MPSFSFLKHPRSQSRQDPRDESPTTLSSSDNEKVQRRASKRDFFRSLLKRSNTQSGPRDYRPRVTQVKPASIHTTTNSVVPTAMTSPMSDPNKPLPLPPKDEETIIAPVKSLKLDRIMSPITTSEVHQLFTGAPQFFDWFEGHHTGAPHPLVAFPWDAGIETRDLSDHLQIADKAWSSATALPHTTRDMEKKSGTVHANEEKDGAHYRPRCQERPNMLSMQGIERGTTGFVAALESGVADALKEAEETNDADDHSLTERRRNFVYSKDGLRAFSESTLMDRLMSLSAEHLTGHQETAKSTVELYTELFTLILYPPSRVTDSNNPYSLQVQIEALMAVLDAPKIWIDFSLVEWRIRLGQILWGPPPDPYPEESVSINGEVVEPGAQKFWLLLQVLLACELSIRLDAESQAIQQGEDSVQISALHRFDKHATESVKWSLILARHWLDNIRIEKSTVDASSEKKVGWLATLTGSSLRHPTNGHVNNLDSFQFRGRHHERQLSGLLHFAQKLQWPNVNHLAEKVMSNGIGMSDNYQLTPAVGTPVSTNTTRSNSYFASRRPTVRRGISRPQKISTIMNPTGWLSNSYLSGLILPGESMSHLLISTLLENDEVAVSRLGEDANLYGGFIYDERSFWSKSCIVGRVLAAGKDSRECMGWISSGITPRGASEGWVNIDVDIPHINPSHTVDGVEKSRIWNKTAIEREGHIVGGSDMSSILPGDFTVPTDDPVWETPKIVLESVDFFAAADSEISTPILENATPYTDYSETPPIRTYSAMMRFSVENGGEKREINLSLTNDVNFVTAHPCVPSHHTEPLNSPTSPNFLNQHQSPTDVLPGI